MDLSGASALVTGGASGIGEQTARDLAAAGARVVIIDRDAERGDAVADQIGGAFCEADVADETAVQEAVDAASELGPLRALVNCAGIGRAGRTINRSSEPMPLAPFEKVLRVNLIGTFNCIRLAASAMAKTDPVTDDGARGAIVNIASVAAFDGQIGQVAYSASKGGIVGITLPIARDLSSVGIRVNCIAPGLIDTPIFGPSEASQDLKGRLANDVVFPKRLGTPAELANVIMMLLTNDYMNGEVIRVDGAARLPPRSG